jgi:intracellular septation protein A
MRQQSTIHLPPFRSLVRRAGVALLESALVPLALFWLFLDVVGFDAGLYAALVWSACAIGVRLVRRSPVPAVLLLTTALLVVRTVIGLATGSPFLYFLQPTAQNFAVALALLATLGLDRPLLAKLADDFCAFPVALTGHPHVKRFFRRVSLLWAGVFLVNGGLTLAVLATQALRDYLVVSTAGSYSLVSAGIGLSLWWFRRSLARHGIRLRLGVA